MPHVLIFWVTFCEGLKLVTNGFLGRESTHLITQFFYQNFISKPIFCWRLKWFGKEREKRGLLCYLSAWGCDPRLFLKIMHSRQNQIYLSRMATKVRMTLRLTEVLPCQWKEIVNRLQDSSLCPLRKKWIHLILASCKVILPNPEKARKKIWAMSTFPPVFYVPSNNKFLFHYYFQVLLF